MSIAPLYNIISPTWWTFLMMFCALLHLQNYWTLFPQPNWSLELSAISQVSKNKLEKEKNVSWIIPRWWFIHNDSSLLNSIGKEELVTLENVLVLVPDFVQHIFSKQQCTVTKVMTGFLHIFHFKISIFKFLNLSVDFQVIFNINSSYSIIFSFIFAIQFLKVTIYRAPKIK